MDMVKMGSFLADLRKEHNFTQTELGEKLGVTNKTISRWETGNYMPPVEMLVELSNLYGLTINELLSGKKLTTEEYKEMAETNIKETLDASTFGLAEKQKYWKKKWRKDNKLTIITCIVIWIALAFAMKFMDVDYFLRGFIGVGVAFLYYFVLNNRMMAYVEKHIYGKNNLTLDSYKF